MICSLTALGKYIFKVVKPAEPAAAISCTYQAYTLAQPMSPSSNVSLRWYENVRLCLLLCLLLQKALLCGQAEA